MKPKLRAVVLLGVIAAGAITLQACSVPVFRFALERWAPDPYPVVIFHNGEIAAEDQKLLDKLGPEGLAGDLFANVFVQKVDVSQIDDETQVPPQLKQLWEQHKTDTLPLAVIRYPIPVQQSAWSGSMKDLRAASVGKLLQSPAREEITERILKGQTGVFVLLECGKKEQDEAAAKLLDEQLKKLQAELKLPEIDPADVQNGLIGVDPTQLKVQFSSVRLKHKDPNEVFLTEMLMGCDPLIGDLREYGEQPMVFPVFGRGRVLYALVGKGINEDNIADACSHLVQSCTCEIKEQNPGMDLLMAVDWENRIEFSQPKEQELPPLAGLSSFVAPPADKAPAEGDPAPKDEEPAAKGETSPTGATDTTATEVERGHVAMSTNILFVCGGMLLLVVFSSILLASRKAS